VTRKVTCFDSPSWIVPITLLDVSLWARDNPAGSVSLTRTSETAAHVPFDTIAET